MTEEVKMSEVIGEVKGTSEDELREVIEKRFESIRTSSMRMGANYIAIAVWDAINKNLKSGMNSSHRDFQRAIKKVVEIISVQLNQQETVQNDLGEVADDGTAE